MFNSQNTTLRLWVNRFIIPAVFVFIWSAGFVVARYAMPYSPPMSFLAVRFFCSLIAFAIWAYFSGVQWPQSKSQTMHLLVVGALMQVGYLGGVWSAVRLGMGAGLSALITGLQPILTAIWFSYVGSKIYPKQWWGLALGFLGVILVLSDKLAHSIEATPLSLFFIVLALACITIGTIYQKHFLKSQDVRVANTMQFLMAFVIALPLALLEKETMHWNIELAGAMIWSVLVSTLLGASLLYVMIQKGATLSVTSLFYLVPPVAAFMAFVLFHEPLSLKIILGTVITTLAVALVVRT